jgi:histidinol-phosphate aminotransferase
MVESIIESGRPGGPQPKPGILEIEAYVPGKSSVAGRKVFKLSSNEQPLGASPMAMNAYANAVDGLALYPDGGATVLRESIAKRFGLDINRIVCGAGSDELLQLLAHAYLGPGDEAIHSQFGFLVYPISIATNGAKAVVAAEKNHTADVDALLACVTPRTKMVFLANPNNPTGTYLPFEEVKRLHAGLPPHVVVVLDAAYAEFVTANDYESGLALVAEFSNVVMTRTFSKIFGLAALRLGWAYCPPAIADVLNRIRGPFNVSAPAIAAGAAAIADTDFVDSARIHNSTELLRVTSALRRFGFDVTESAGNFVLVHFGSKHRAHAADAALLDNNIIVRRMDAYALSGALRISIGTADANDAVIATLGDFAARGRAK